MKRLYQRLSIGTLGFVLFLPLVNSLPAVAEIANPLEMIAQAVKRPEIMLNLAVARKQTKVTVQGEKVIWQQLEDQTAVTPGDILRYTIEGENRGDSAANNLAVTQPIPAQMTYRLDSARSKSEAEISYSIDHGETFVAEPTIKITQEDGTVVEAPAPADVYTHIRWKFPTVTPELGAKAMYEVQVQ